MNSRYWAIVGATIAAIIYGITFTVAKDVMPLYIKPYGFILLRVFGATLLFWFVYLLNSLLNKNIEKIALVDFPRIIACAFFGICFNMLTFFKGLSYTSPISAAVIMVSTPVVVLLLSALLIKEKITLKKGVGITLGLLGTCILILYGKKLGNAPYPMLGNLLVFANAVSYGFYLILVKKLMDKYNAFSFIHWIYTFGFLMVIPFGWEEFTATIWLNIPTNLYFTIGFVVVFSTFVTYMLNLVAMRQLKPTTLSVFIYLQPVFATIFALLVGKDTISSIKIIASFCIFLGVYLVTKK